MKNSIKLILTVAVILSVTFSSFAQRGGDKKQSPEVKAAQQTAKMVKNLSLNEKQEAEVKEINLSYAKKVQEVKASNQSNDKEAMKAARADLSKGRSAELAKVLTSTQLKTYENRKVATKGGKGGHNKVSIEEIAEKNTTRMAENLSLDQAQTARVNAINLDYAKKLKVAQDTNKGKGKEAMKSVRDNLNKSRTMELKNVLTTAQFKTYEEMKTKKKGNRIGGKRKARS